MFGSRQSLRPLSLVRSVLENKLGAIEDSFCPESVGTSETWETQAHGRCGYFRCSRPTAIGPEPSSPNSSASQSGRSGAALPPLAVDDDEAVALAISLRSAAQGAVAGIEDSSVRALAKIVQVMPPKLRQRVDALSAVTVPAVWGTRRTVDADVLTTVAQACRNEERMRFSYTRRGGETTERHVEPHRLVSLGRRWYLVAFDLTRDDWRSFRIDRLRDPNATAIRFHPRELPGGDAAAFVRAGIENMPAAYTVEVIVNASVDAVRAAIGPWGTVEQVDEDRCRLLMTIDSLDWPAFAVGAVRADFEVVGPPEFVEHLREWGERFTRAAEQ